MAKEKETFPTKEAAVWLAARAAFFEYMNVKKDMGDICPELFFESWIKGRIFYADKEFEDLVFDGCMKLLNSYRKKT